MAKNIKKINELIPSDFKYLFDRLFKYTWQYKFLLFFSLFSLIIYSLTNAAFLSIIKKITDHAFSPDSTIKQIKFALMLFSIMIVRALSGLFSNFIMKSVSLRVVESIRSDIFKRTLMLPMKYFDKNPTSFIVSKVNNDVLQLSGVIHEVTFS